jgi:PPM family protein phosphatase
MEIEHAVLHEQGKRPYNEDCFGVWSDARYSLFLVADGAGGQGGGEVASSLVRDHFLAEFSKAPELSEAALQQALYTANEQVLSVQQSEARLAHMRSTLVSLVIDRQAHLANWVWCGDSRGYLFRQRLIDRRTQDHSLVQHMLDAGLIDELMAQEHPKKNLLWSALGNIKEELQIGIGEVFAVSPGDQILLCSDGVWEPLGDAFLCDALAHAPSAKQWLSQLDRGLRERDKPEQDNYTGLAIWFTQSDDVTRIL